MQEVSTIIRSGQLSAVENLLLELDRPKFSHRLFSHLNDVVRIDGLLSFQCGRDHRINKFYTASMRSTTSINRAGGMYARQFCQVDPIWNMSKRQAEVEPHFVRLRGPDISHQDYREACWDRTGVIDRLTMLLRLPQRWVGVSIYREFSSGYYSDADMEKATTSLRPLLILAARHLDTIPTDPGLTRPAGDSRDSALELLQQSRQQRLSRRELEICRLGLDGMGLKEISSHTGLGMTTIVTYRQRAYSKLGIRKTADLWAAVADIQDLRPAR